MTIEEIRETFRGDRFATNAGCEVQEASAEKVVCTMPVSEKVLNAQGNVMGGAIFTLCDLAFAVAANYGGIPSVAVESNIRFFAATKGALLTATCVPDREGKTLGNYTVTVTDDLGAKIAGYTAVAFHKNGRG